MSAKRIVVTGGAGFIGTHLCRRLAAEGHQVVSLDIAEPKTPVAGVRYVKGDVRDRSQVAQTVAGADAVYHFAAIVSVPVCQGDPEESYATNLIGTCRVLEAIRADAPRRGRPARIVFAGSSAVYGHAGREGVAIREEDASIAPLSFYAAQKLGSEQMIRIYRDTYGIPAVVFRFFNVYGPGQDPSSPYSGVISIFSTFVPQGKGLSLHGGGSQTRDFVSVHDVARANHLALELPDERCDGQAINLGTGRTVTIRELSEEMIRIYGKSVERTNTPARQGDVLHSMAAIGRAKSALGWEPKVALREGLRELLLGEAITRSSGA